MGWMKQPLGASDTFEVYSTLGTSEYFVGGVSSGLLAKPDLVEDEIVYINYTRSSHVVGDAITVSFSLKLVANGISTTGKIYMEFPENFIVKSNTSAFEVRLLNTNTVLTSSLTYYTNSIKRLDLTSPCASFVTGCLTNMVLNISLTGIKNPNFYVNISSTINVYSTTSEGWHIDKGISIPLYQMFNALQLVPITGI